MNSLIQKKHYLVALLSLNWCKTRILLFRDEEASAQSVLFGSSVPINAFIIRCGRLDYPPIPVGHFGPVFQVRIKQMFFHLCFFFFGFDMRPAMSASVWDYMWTAKRCFDKVIGTYLSHFCNFSYLLQSPLLLLIQMFVVTFNNLYIADSLIRKVNFQGASESN